MKSIVKYIGGFLCAATLVGAMSSCERQDYPDRFVATDGVPVIDFIRYADREVFITQAYMDEILCVVGDNLTSVNQVLFNDQKAILNTSFITKNTLILSVPNTPAQVKTDKIYFINAAKDTVSYDFKVLPPAPKINSLSSEWAEAGQTVTLKGSYFMDVESISFPGAEVSEYTIVNSETITLTVPQGASAGPIEIVTASGSGRSSFQYRDSRNMLFDFDGLRGGMAAGNGWRAPAAGHIHNPGDDAFPAVDGSYMWLGGENLKANPTEAWAEDAYSFNYWPSTDASSAIPPLKTLPEFSAYLEKYGVSGLTLKFECLIPASAPWKTCSMQVIFSGTEYTSNENMSNAYFSDTSLARALWTPWQATGSYDTADKWITVSIPLTEFTYSHEGNALNPIDSKALDGFSLFVWAGFGGSDCSPVIAIDHIRVVPL